MSKTFRKLLVVLLVLTVTLAFSGISAFAEGEGDDGVVLTVENKAKMFKPTAATLVTTDEGMMLKLTYESDSYDKAYVGTADDAVYVADETKLVVKSEGKYYNIPVEKTGEVFTVAFRSVNKRGWYDRTFLVDLVENKLTTDSPGTTVVLEPITVTLSVNNRGELAKANDGSCMANKEVTVEDIDKSGEITFDEAMVAAHKAYNQEDGYGTTSSGYVNKLWGTDTSNCLFFVNDECFSTAVTGQKVVYGDRLYASLNADDKYYGDWYTVIEPAYLEVTDGDEVTMTLTGYQGSTAYLDMTLKPVEGATIKTVDGEPLGTTDKNGSVTFKAPEIGDYIITASGAVSGEVTDWACMNSHYIGDKENQYLVDGTEFVIFDDDLFEWTGMGIGYTKKDYGYGPYPLAEVKWIDYADWQDEGIDGYIVMSNQFISDCPIMAPAATLKVLPVPADPIKVTVTVSNKGTLATDKDGNLMANKTVTVEDLDRSKDFTYDEALVAVHKAYLSEDGYATSIGSLGLQVDKLWGVETSGCLFYTNDESISSGVGVDTVKDGDSLYAAILVDTAYWSDLYTTISPKEIKAAYNEEVTVTLTGFSWSGSAPLEGVTVKIANGDDLGITNENGEVTFKAPKVGEYILTAEAPADGTPIMAPAAALTVEKADISKAKVASVKNQTYTGKEIKPTPKVTFNGKTLKKGTDYTITYKNNKNVGKATITVEGKGNYKGTATKTFKIVKAKNTLKATAKKKTFTVKYAKLKKANQTLTRKTVLNVTKAQGTVSYKKTSGTKKITVNKKTGKITIKKGLKKSTYTIKIKVTAAGTKNYKSGSKTVTVKIKVK